MKCTHDLGVYFADIGDSFSSDMVDESCLTMYNNVVRDHGVGSIQWFNYCPKCGKYIGDLEHA